jgi:hypothetical protein
MEDHSEIGRGGIDWIDLAQNRLVESSCEHGNEPSVSIKCWKHFCVAERLAASQAILSSMELVGRF